ncbi:MAG TPA: ScpA family protein [Parvibaculum sp.]|uniref:segregation and condensation protein A n=1 Tax=Parvibaculum sp. TaxID=2024848 RepID=UPI002BCDACEF|nr:ScpA family protein [Parvibaculum sp.]HMM13561.1 ScpA family protein [Parvibaculum sp.]
MNEAPSHNEAEAGAPAAGLVAHPEGGSAEGAPVPGESFEEGRPIAATEAEAEQESLIVDLDGFEGPLDVLLTLARNQKVDLTRISILQLAEQYLDFINRAHRMELDLAADYLVMASWLAYLKSRLLLPPPDEEEGPSGAEMAARLAFQLQRLESMRNASQALFARQRLGIHVFQRGVPEGIRVVKTSEYQGSLFELLKAYSEQRLKGRETRWEPKRLPILAIEIARKRLENMLGMMFDWGRIDAFLPADFLTGELRRSALASTLSAALVLAKDGAIEIAQAGAYQPLFVRRKRPGEGSAAMPADDTDDQQIEE